jgi:hypothetical protein
MRHRLQDLHCVVNRPESSEALNRELYRLVDIMLEVLLYPSHAE